MPKKTKLQKTQEDILTQLLYTERELLTDGYHSFKTLYDFRLCYNALLFNEWAKGDEVKYDVHKSIRHNDGSLCFGGGWFIVVAMLPDGQISNHYDMKHWDMFKIPVTYSAKYKYDGHTTEDTLERIIKLIKND